MKAPAWLARPGNAVRSILERRGGRWLAGAVVFFGALFFLLPIYATLDFSLRATKDVIGFRAYELVFADVKFLRTFSFSMQKAGLTILFSLLLIVPTVYWVHLKFPRIRPVIEFIALIPFVIPTVVLVFGLIRTYGGPPLPLTSSPETTDILLVGGYIVITMPYMFRAVDTGLRSIDVRALTEAALSLGATWPTVLFRVIFPNLRVAVISGALITFATVIGELILASFLARPAFGPYMFQLGSFRAYEPAALSILSYAMTWASLALIDVFGRGREGSRAAVTIH